jgi:hypothetical protein
MTEFIAFLLLVAVATAGLGSWLYYRHAQRELLRLQEYEFFSNRFFAASDALIGDSDTPEVVLNMLHVVNEMIGSELASKRFLKGYEAYYLDARRQNRRPVIRADVNEFMNKRGALGKQFADALMSGVMAMTFLSDGWGMKARAMLADAFVREPKPSDVIEVLEHSGCLPQAA